MAAVDRYLKRYDAPPRSLYQAELECAEEKMRWLRQMVRFAIENIRICRSQGRPMGARKAGSSLEHYVAEWRRWNRTKWAAKRSLNSL